MSHKTVVVDEIFEQLEAAKSGVVPGSVCQAVVAGIQNVPSQIVQHAVGGASGTSYTTFPLSPIMKNCCIDKSYLNFEFDINYKLTATFGGALTNNYYYEIPYYFGARDTPSIFNQIQIMIENSTIWQTVYQREEATLAYNSLPETEIRGNNQYASIDKIKNHAYCPMKRMVAKLKGDGAATSFDINQTVHLKLTVDLNRLTPLLSNLHFTTPHMGNLRLKVFMQEIEKALFFCPDYNFMFNPVPTDNSAANIQVASASSPLSNQFWQFYPLNEFFGSAIANTKIPFLAFDKAHFLIANPATITFSNPAAGDFMTFANSGIAEIVQTCFDIKDEEYQRLNDHFATLGSVIIPCQVWNSNIFNNSMINKGNPLNTTMIGNVGGYNIDFVSVWFHGSRNPACLTKEFLNQFQLLLDGRPINAIPYQYINDKCVVDMTQAIIDTDHEEINKDYIDSLTFLNLTDEPSYVSEAPHATFGDGTLGKYLGCNELRCPNCFSLNFSTNLPDAFHSGACILENSNRQAVLRLTLSQARANLETNRDAFPYFLNSYNQEGGTVCGFSCFCDACIVLTYDAARGTCFDGQLSWAAPYQ